MSDDRDLVESIAARAQALGLTVAAAESLTSGAVASLLGAGTNAAEWFRGAVVAYDESVKFDVLGVDPGPVVNERCARQMAVGALELLGADVAVALTGVGGPGEVEGCPPGTVHIAVAQENGTGARELLLDGPPDSILSQAVTASLHELSSLLTSQGR